MQVTGFTDLAPIVREQTVKSVLVIVNKLSDRVINGELLKHMAKTANDEQPGIRTNTTICLGKIAKNLGPSSRTKVLIAAFTRSLRDPFVHARNAALQALSATAEYFSDEDCATKVLPAICPSLIDKEKMVRDQANKCMDVYMAKIRKAAAAMPDTVLPPQPSTEAAGARMSTPQPAEANSWAGWAISSFTNKLSAAAGEIQPAAASNGTSVSASAPRITSPAPAGLRPTPTTSSASALHRQIAVSPPPPISRSSSTTPADAYFKDPVPVADDDDFGGDAWGDMGDMDDDPDDGLTRTPRTATATTKKATAAAPVDDGAEPDFAGWLAAQEKKKAGGPGGKPLPKGLTKSGGGAAGARKASATAAPKPKPVVAKKLDLKPKAPAEDDDGWGDGW